MVNIGKVVHGSKPVMVMMMVQFAYSVMNILNKLAVNEGVSLKILVVFRMIFATAFIVPLALIVERKKRPKLTWLILFQAFVCGLFGILLSQNLYIIGLSLTSATFVTAISNLIPAITFILAICFRMENLKLGTLSGKAKILGTIIGLGGAMIFTFYKGPEISIWSTKIDLVHHGQSYNGQKGSGSYLLGVFVTIVSGFTVAAWLIAQTKLSIRYPCEYSCTALVTVMGLIQCMVYTISIERDWNKWKLGFNIKLYAAIYSGIMISGLINSIISWCIAKKGPVFISIFSPLTLLLVALGGSLVLDEKLHCGSIVGGILIVGGLYLMLWGKSKEIKKKEVVVSRLPQCSLESGVIQVNGDGNEQTSNARINGESSAKEDEITEI